MSEPVAIEAPDVVAAPDAASGPPASDERGPGPVGIALLVAGFVIAGLAQYLPWSSVDVRAATDPDAEDRSDLPSTIDLDLASFSDGHVLAYLGTLALALVGIGVMLSVRGPSRRAAAAAALGLLAGNGLVLVGFRRAIEHVGGSALASYRLPEDMIHVGAGYAIAIASTVVLAAGVMFASRILPAFGRRRFVEDPHDGSEPLELTVSPVR